MTIFFQDLFQLVYNLIFPIGIPAEFYGAAVKRDG